MGSDHPDVDYLIVANQFQSTLPGWGATIAGACDGDRQRFQSTLPGWGATKAIMAGFAQGLISIHAPRMGSDLGHHGPLHQQPNFNPRSPDGERPCVLRALCRVLEISIHAPRMGSDRENGHLRPRYGQNHPFSTLIVSQIVVDVLGTVRKSQKHQRTSHYEVIKQPERRK